MSRSYQKEKVSVMRKQVNYQHNKYLNFLIRSVFLVCVVLFFVPEFSYANHLDRANPKLANYYLGEINRNEDFVQDLERYDVLILTPTQIKIFPDVIASLKERHRGVIILAYVPSQSYNERYWPNDIIFRNIPTDSSWWLRDSHGKIVSTWPDLFSMNMSEAWSRALVNFTNTHIANLAGVDGIFFDIVSDNISWANGGDVDVNGDGQRDTTAAADALWKSRVVYFLQYARQHLNTKYIIINGSSNTAFQPYVNGRMFETFPTPWEGDGTWTTIMNNLVENKKFNNKEHLIIFNGNTLNTGEQNNFKAVRYGIASSLLENDVYYSFDFGDQDHGQLWWYDEYNVDLGHAATGPLVYTPGASVFSARIPYAAGVWRRDFERGISVVNSTKQSQAIELGGDYEKIHGLQDGVVNNGSIVSEVTLGADDGLILLKTFSTIDNILYTNGDFARFLRPTGQRLRNGTFIFNEAYRGGDQIAHIDLNGDNELDWVIVTHNNVTAYRHDGQLFLRVYPYNASHVGGLSVAIADTTGDKTKEIVVASASRGKQARPVKVYGYDGTLVKDSWYPFGRAYVQGLTVAVGRLDGKQPIIIFGSAPGEVSRVTLFDAKTYRLVRQWTAYERTFRGGVSVAAGDVDGDGKDEIIAGPGKGRAATVKIWNNLGREAFRSFTAFQSRTNPGVRVGAADIDFDGKKDVVVWTSSVGL